MTEVTRAMSTEAMRAEADQLNASVREDNRSLYERQRRAAQLAYEADLIDDAALTHAEWQGASSALSRHETAVQEAITAERAAEDRLRAEDRQLSRVRSEQGKADPRDGDVQEKLALQVAAREGAVRACKAATEAATAVRAEAERKRADWGRHVDRLGVDCDAAKARATNPGTAPNLPGIAPGVSKLSDMDDETRAALALVVTTLASQSLSSSSQGPDAPGRNRRTTRGELAAQDPSGYRYVRTGTGMNVIPPDWRGTGR